MSLEYFEFSYPLWLILPGLILAGAFTLLLYYRTKSGRQISTIGILLLSSVRFVSVFLIYLLLLAPVLRTNISEIKKPIVIFTQDQSQSIREEMDSQALLQYQIRLEEIKEEFKSEFAVFSYAFGLNIREDIDYKFDDPASNCSSIIDFIGELYGDQNLGAVIYATDGIFNEGIDPVYSNLNFSAPIYPIALGDTSLKRDLLISKVLHNDIAYEGDQTTIQINIRAYNCSGSESEVQIQKYESGRFEMIDGMSFSIDRDDYFRTIEMPLTVEGIGLKRYRVVLKSLSGESSSVNNIKDFFIEVIKAQQKILLLAATPHPDIAALKGLLEKNRNYELESHVLKDFKGSVNDFDLVILHQIPSLGNTAEPIFEELEKQKKPVLTIVGSRTNLNLLNRRNSMVSIDGRSDILNEVSGKIAPGFNLFNLSESIQRSLPDFAPMLAPFGEYKINPVAHILLYQRIGKIDTEYPLIILSEEDDIKSGIICGEGIWRWKLYDYLQNGNNQILEELIGKITQYLTLQEDKRRFRVYQNKNLLYENEEVFFDAELYNQSFQLINEPEVNITLLNSNNEAFNYTFTRQDQKYVLNTGKLPVDDYRWSASTSWAGEQFHAEGQFSIQTIQKENFQTVANHQILHHLAAKSGGEVVYPSNLDTLPVLIRSKENLRPVLYSIVKTRQAINLKWVFLLLLGLLILEWTARRYFGTY